MRVTDLVLFLTYTLTSTSAVLLVKQFASAAWAAVRSGAYVTPATMFVALGAGLYAVSFLLWMLVLTRNELSVAYPVMVGLTLAATTIVAWLILKEPIEVMRLVGVVVIFAGIFLVTQTQGK